MKRRSTILLVEDSPDDVLLFQMALRDGGHDFGVQVVRTAEQAIEYLQRACKGGEVPDYPVPRFIIMDNNMPRTAGSDFLRWLSHHPVYRVVPTVILSGNEQPGEVKLAFELGVQGYFVEPSRQKDLVELMKLIFHYWAQSSIPPVSEYEVTARGEQPVLKWQR